MLDTITIELKVTAVQGESDIWMQGDLEITINGEKPYSHSDIVDSYTMLESLESNGKYFIFSCCCGLPQCSGWNNGIEVIHEENNIKWIDSDHNRTWNFDRKKIEEDLNNINKEVKIYKKFFNEKQIDYVGFGFGCE
ncbi:MULTISPECIES: hypothetical protein [Flavobacterium]|uniref:hypothetical protein n=1 Tax=Flavobacterium TaxID=237 RepID=UPI0011823A01|nr:MULTISPECIES: hypothetical protein [Flavobacterium]MCR4030598.1 hypothetical protein [Flavobacterium panacis]